jgi:hypothetical protein
MLLLNGKVNLISYTALLINSQMGAYVYKYLYLCTTINDSGYVRITC